ncbi:MAG: DUF4159 domain-containing protein [Gemmatimonadota bacterium]
MSRTRLRALVVLCVCLAGVPLLAQRGFRGGPPIDFVERAAPYDGRFAFARLKFVTAPGGYYYRGLPAWAHGYPNAENHLSRIMSEVSAIKVIEDARNVLALDDPELFKFPVAYMAEAGYWTMTDKEAAGLRAFLLKGGFVIFDDFRDDGRNAGGYANFEMQMKRVFPNARLLPMTHDHPIYHSFFEIPSLDLIPQSYGSGPPTYLGLFENNDPKKRLMAIINFNTDVADFWEFSSQGFYPIAEGNEAYKLGVNYMVYALTH